jgi:hypothetical protein
MALPFFIGSFEKIRLNQNGVLFEALKKILKKPSLSLKKDF